MVQVLDEIGINMSQAIGNAPAARKTANKASTSAAVEEDEEDMDALVQRLAALRQ